MKKIALSLSIVLSSFFTANAQVNAQHSGGTGMLTFYTRETSNEKIEGSAYEVEKFELATVNNGTEKFPLRFNLHENVMEYQNPEKEIFTLDKNLNKDIKFNNRHYVLIQTPEGENYVKVVYQGKKSTVYAFEKINLRKATAATSSYDTAKPASYSRAKDIYFIDVNGKVTLAPTKTKELINLAPNLEKEIKSFVKTEKIDFKSENDFKKIANFLEQNI